MATINSAKSVKSQVPLLVPSSIPDIDDPELISYIIPDFKALNNISDEFTDEFLVLEEIVISGFEIYIVEQWACERKIGTVITTFTGSSDNVIKAIKVTVIKRAENQQFPKRFQNYLDEMFSNHAKLKESESDHFGYLFVTNLSAFPSNLNLLPIPNGDIRTTYDTFNVNVDLRRMKCGGRSGLLLNKPSDASEDKFRQMYKINLKVPISYAVKELVNIVQICLFYFDMLNPIFGDGLLCNKTEEAISGWWDNVGFRHFNIKQKDGSLSPTSVSAIVGIVLSVRIRLNIAGTDVPKDPFDVENFRLSIGHFQRQQRLERTWRIDPSTFERLYSVTNHKANKELKKFTKVVKSTVQDHIGKSSSKLNPWDVETTDIETMIKYLSGSRLIDLWYGKSSGDAYNFLSLADIINHTSHNEYNTSMNLSQVLKNQQMFINHNLSHNAITKGVDKIRSGLQNRKVAIPREEIFTSPQESFDGTNGGRKVGASTNEKSIESDSRINTSYCDNNILPAEVDIMKNLKRRRSFPYMKREINLKHLENTSNCNELISRVKTAKIYQRSQSFSNVEDSIHQTKRSFSICPMVMSEVFLQAIIDNMDYTKKLDDFENNELKLFQHSLDEATNQHTKIENSFNIVNKHQETTRQNFKVLDLKLSDLDTIIARLTYETRLLSKRVKDVEENSEQFSKKVEITSSKLSEIYKILLPKNEIYEKFKNDTVKENEQTNTLLFSLKYYFNMIYDFFVYILMGIDLNRVRSLWVKVDPNRRVTNKFYNFLGKDSTKLLQNPDTED